VFLEPYEILDSVALGEAFDDALAMLPDAASQVRGHASVERAVTSARHDIDVEIGSIGGELTSIPLCDVIPGAGSRSGPET
jgi:hypothetical protein